MKIAAALSGGVDSAVAAALLKEQGHDLVGVTALVWPDSRCCDAQALSDAALVARALEIPYFTVEVMDEFRKEVVDPFVADYTHGRTPNPCPLCNTKIRFGIMWEKILEQYPDCDAVATGHYTKIVDSCQSTNNQQLTTNNRWTLHKGIDSHKDQSYMLYGLSQEQLSRTLTPLGEYTKDQVRDLAEKYGLFVSKKPDSQDACFVSGDYKRFLEEYRNKMPKVQGQMSNVKCLMSKVQGQVVDMDGNILGTHHGIWNYTIGQRKGLNLQRQGDHNQPLYVVGIDSEKNRVIVGDYDDCLSAECTVDDINWIVSPTESLINITIKIRYNSPEVPAILTVLEDGSARCDFDTPQHAVTPGQAAVFYEGDMVLGGGIIK